ncbi:MAG: M23 family metallopeptidase [Aggregatilineales bacterium]
MFRKLCILSIILAACLTLLGAPAHAQDFPIRKLESAHHWLDRPLGRDANRRAAQGYPYGWHRNQRSPIHHGVDMPNAHGTPVLAAAEGTVYYAGDDQARVFGAKANFYGNLIVLQHDFEAPEGGRVFTLYGHLSRIDVQTGQRVARGERIGAVGATGIALGDHLHFEVRVGNPDDYFAVRNPELWYAPLRGTGTLIGRLLNADGSKALGVRVTLSAATFALYTFTYADPSLPSDPALDENFSLADLPAGCYSLRVRGTPLDVPFCLRAGETLFIEARLP